MCNVEFLRQVMMGEKKVINYIFLFEIYKIKFNYKNLLSKLHKLSDIRDQNVPKYPEFNVITMWLQCSQMSKFTVFLPDYDIKKRIDRSFFFRVYYFNIFIH